MFRHLFLFCVFAILPAKLSNLTFDRMIRRQSQNVSPAAESVPPTSPKVRSIEFEPSQLPSPLSSNRQFIFAVLLIVLFGLALFVWPCVAIALCCIVERRASIA
uniref:Transmembrane protein n=1 Tax=Globodera rostochiensis TaxID=31243 RepID=A0A914I9F0_GLORO